MLKRKSSVWTQNETLSGPGQDRIRTRVAKIGETPGTVAVTEGVTITEITTSGAEAVTITEEEAGEASADEVASDKTPSRTKMRMLEINNVKRTFSCNDKNYLFLYLFIFIFYFLL